MRASFRYGVAALAVMAVGGIAFSSESAEAQARQKTASPPSPSFDSGGAVGCFYESGMTSNQAAVARRLGGTPCASSRPAPTVPARPTPRAEQVAYQADGYIVRWKQPGYCSLFLDTPRGATVIVLYRADGSTEFGYYRRGLALDPSMPSYPALFQFDGSNELMTYDAADMTLDDGRAGFLLANAGGELLEGWASARSVTIRLGSASAKPFDTVSLQGSGPAIAALRQCTQGRGAPMAQTAGIIQPEPSIAPAPPSGSEPAFSAPVTDRRFPSGERISLSFEPAGIGGTGTITRRAPGQPTKTVTIDYMSEFTAIAAADRVQYTVMGTTEQGQQSWACEVTIDWRTARVVAARDLSRFAHPSCADSAIASVAKPAPVKVSPPAANSGITRAFLADAWVLEGNPCGGEADLFLKNDGTYFAAEHEAGQWRFDGTILNLTALERASEEGGDLAPVSTPTPVAFTVKKFSTNVMMLRRPGVPDQTLNRC